MSILLVLNAIGLACGFSNWTNIMYIVLGITWTGFFSEYSKITWKFYERLTENEDIDVVIDVRLTNTITVIFLMVMVYFLLCNISPNYIPQSHSYASYNFLIYCHSHN